jgi:hypothetical protein
MNPKISTPHQLPSKLPDWTQEIHSAFIIHRGDIDLDVTTHTGNHLILHVSRTHFDALCMRLGNAYKAGCWITARCREVDGLSQQCIERYVNMMAHDKLGLERGLNRVDITVAPPQGRSESDVC